MIHGIQVMIRGLRRWGMVGVVAGLLAPAMRAEVDVLHQLAGTWALEENHAVVDDPSNPRHFSIERVLLNPTKWADGQFDLRWAGEASPVRGYFSQKTGRVWVKSPRRVAGRRTSVEYSGTLRWADGLVWGGLAYTDGRKESWGFEAVRSSP